MLGLDWSGAGGETRTHTPRGNGFLRPARPPIPLRGRLEQLLELPDAEAGVGHDTAHGIGVDGIAAWDGKKPAPVGHHHVLAAFTSDPKASPSEGTDGAAVIDARYLGHR